MTVRRLLAAAALCAAVLWVTPVASAAAGTTGGA